MDKEPIVEPRVIEETSFKIIEEETKQRKGRIPFGLGEWMVVRRLIHTTADFDVLDNIVFHSESISSAIGALKEGCNIVTDTKMAAVGISSHRLDRCRSEVFCFVGDKDVGEEAKKRGCTRSIVALDKAIRTLKEPIIFAIGNAPTALYRLLEHMEEGRIRPALVIGMVVGFVGAADSKDALMDSSPVPYIVLKGRKGGSTLVAATLNALLDMACNQ